MQPRQSLIRRKAEGVARRTQGVVGCGKGVVSCGKGAVVAPKFCPAPARPKVSIMRPAITRMFDLNFRPTPASNVLSMMHRHAFLVLAAFTLLLAGCRKPAVESYRVPKETEPA